MIIYHDENLEVTHTITLHDPSYDPHSNGPNHVVLDQLIPHDRVHLERNKLGEVVASEKKDFPGVLLVDQIKLGSEAVFYGIPEGTRISVNGAPAVVMDGSGLFELEPQAPGFYKVRFELERHMHMEVSVEVLGND